MKHDTLIDRKDSYQLPSLSAVTLMSVISMTTLQSCKSGKTSQVLHAQRLSSCHRKYFLSFLLTILQKLLKTAIQTLMMSSVYTWLQQRHKKIPDLLIFGRKISTYFYYCHGVSESYLHLQLQLQFLNLLFSLL